MGYEINAATEAFARFAIAERGARAGVNAAAIAWRNADRAEDASHACGNADGGGCSGCGLPHGGGAGCGHCGGADCYDWMAYAANRAASA